MRRRTWQTLSAIVFLVLFTAVHFFALRYLLRKLLYLYLRPPSSPYGSAIGVGKDGPLRTEAPLKIFVYDVPAKLLHRDYDMNMDSCPFSFYSVELIIPQLVRTSAWSLNVTQTKDALEADYFLLPHYSTCYYTRCLRSAPSEECQERVSSYMTDILNHVEEEYPFWGRRQGADHIVVLSWDWGAHLYGDRDVSLVRNRLAATVQLTLMGMRTEDERQLFDPRKDISIPPLRDYRIAQQLLDGTAPAAAARTSDRAIFAYFRGTITSEWLYSRGIRQRILRYGEEDPSHYFVRTGHSEFYWHELRNARFALCPAGWSHWSPRLFDAIVAGAIPVIIADEWEPAFSGTFIDYARIAVRVAEKDLERLTDILMGVTPQQQARMREEMRRVAHRLNYNTPSRFNDALDSILQVLATHRPRPAPLQSIFGGGGDLGGNSDAEYSHGEDEEGDRSRVSSADESGGEEL